MAVFEYVPLATSPSSGDTENADLPNNTRPRRRIPYIPFAIPWHLFTRTRVLILIPLLVLPIIFQIFFSYVRSSTHLPSIVDLHPADNPYFYTGDVWKHNEEVAANLERCASLGLLRNTSLPFSPDERPSADEEAEAITQGCGTNQTTVVILASLWFAEAFAGVNTAGEVVYAQSVISTLNAHNYSYVFSSLGWWNDDMRKTTELWHKHRWNVRMVLADPTQVDLCWNVEDQKCLKTKDNMEGIEAWRLLTFWYWDDPGNPLGEPFTLSPSPRNNNHFLSYSIEPTCRRLPFLPADQRAHPPQAYLLAKQAHYFADGPKFSWTIPFLAHLQSALNIKIVAGFTNDEETAKKDFDRAGLTDFGRLGKIEFYERLALSFVFVGVGQPRISPSPWDALCMGVPFINPVLQWDEADPLNRTKWTAQQWHMTDLDPPYVYSVHTHDLEGLKAAVTGARDHPIDSYIPDYMKFDFACQKAAELVEGDWRGKAAEILEQRIIAGEGRLFVM